MPVSGEQSELAFYDFLRKTDTHSPATQDALGFARTFADLARRVIAARACQEGSEVHYPANLAFHALRAWLEGGPEGLAGRLHWIAESSWGAGTLKLLPPLAEWLARHYQRESPVRSSLQVWVGREGERGIRLFGWATANPQPGIPPLPAPFEALARIPNEDLLADCAPDAAGLLSHYDVHGLSMLALSRRYLQQIGVSNPDCALSFEWTGDIGKLWKRAVPKTIAAERGLRAVVMLDCSVHSRKPVHTLRAIAKLDNSPGAQLIVIDHHPDTFTLAPQMMHEHLQLVLTDVFSCGLTKSWGEEELQIMALGALGDKVPEIDSAYPRERYPQLQAAVEEYHRWHLHFSPTPPALRGTGQYPLQPLWEALAAGRAVSPELARETLGTLPPPEPLAQPEFEKIGGVVVVTQRLALVGRAWYALLEELMAQTEAPYAMALRLLDKRRANFLLLTRWQWTHVPPVQYFIPERHMSQVLGHPGALWADMDKDQAPDFIREFISAANAYLGLPGETAEAIARIKQNILDAEPVRPEAPEHEAEPEGEEA